MPAGPDNVHRLFWTIDIIAPHTCGRGKITSERSEAVLNRICVVKIDTK